MDGSKQLGGQKRLLQEVDPGIEDTAVYDRVLRVTRDEQYTQPRDHFRKAIGQRASAHTRQHHVRNQKVEGWRRFREAQGLSAVVALVTR